MWKYVDIPGKESAKKTPLSPIFIHPVVGTRYIASAFNVVIYRILTPTNRGRDVSRPYHGCVPNCASGGLFDNFPE